MTLITQQQKYDMILREEEHKEHEPVLCERCYKKARAVQNVMIFACCLVVIIVAGLLAV